LAKQYQLKVWALGCFRIQRGEDWIDEQDWESQKALDLFKYLHIQAGRAVSTDALIDELWPDYDLDTGRKRVYDTVYRLRKMLDSDAPQSSSFIMKSAAGYSLNINKGCWFDWQELTSIYDWVRQRFCPGAEDADNCLNMLIRGVELYKGEFMPNDKYKEWTHLPREQYKNMFLDMLSILVTVLSERKADREALTYAYRGIQEDPLQEDFYFLAFKILKHQNRFAEAMSLYRRYEQIIKKEIGVLPSREMQDAFQELCNSSVIRPETRRRPGNIKRADPGAIRCDSARFRDLLQVEVGKSSGLTSSSTLFKITFACVPPSHLMDRLADELTARLRRMDAVTKWDPRRIYILLHDTPVETSNVVAQRLYECLEFLMPQEKPAIDFTLVDEQNGVLDALASP